MLSDSIVATRDGRIGHLLVNRPKALNALDLPMIRAIAAALEAWRDNPAVHAVVVEGAGDRAFCAGGDIRAIRSSALAGDAAAVEAFFAEEYSLNAAIAAYPKPYVALIDGICMGGGIGISVHGSHRVTTEHGLFAMPETAIAMFPDIGASYVLPRLPGELGLYLGLTGARIGGVDAVYAGLATHLVPRAELPALRNALARDGVAAIGAAASVLPGFALAEDRAAIDRCFAADSVPELVEQLEREKSGWASHTLDALRVASPSAVFWSFALLRAGADRDLGACLNAELRLTRHVSRHPDFAEGVRAMIVDKDRTPRWTPATLETVDPAAIAAMLD